MAVKTRNKPMIVIRKEEVVASGHHGGAWKVAYADFVTAMMAFFLLMWLLNATTEEQRIGLADYFSPNNLMARSTSGSGQPFGGTTPNAVGSLASDRGAMQPVRTKPIALLDIDEDDSDTPAIATSAKREGGAAANGESATAAGDRAGTAATMVQLRLPVPIIVPRETALHETALRETERVERQAFERAAEQIREAVRNDPALAEVAHQLAIDVTPEGLRIQIIDEDRRPMFPTGSAQMAERARALLAKVAPVLLRLPEQIAIDGHTDSAAYRGTDRSNWDLSAERANATRRILGDMGLSDDRFRSVSGHADRDPLIKEDRMAAANRRIAIMVLRRSAPNGAPGGAPIATPVSLPGAPS